MKTIKLSEKECKMLWNVINYMQSRVIEKQANMILAYRNNETYAEMMKVWDKETIDEWFILHNLKKRLQ